MYVPGCEIVQEQEDTDDYPGADAPLVAGGFLDPDTERAIESREIAMQSLDTIIERNHRSFATRDEAEPEYEEYNPDLDWRERRRKSN